MHVKSIGYWGTTTIVALELLAGGMTDLLRGRTMLVAGPPVEQVVTRLGYSEYLLTILGWWKLLGGITLLVPRSPRLKEWAYAGTIFELTGAAASSVVRDKYGDALVAPLAFATLAIASWALRPSDRRLDVRGEPPACAADRSHA